MTREDQELLLMDLSARVPYKVVAQVGEGWKTEDREVLGVYADGNIYVDCIYVNIKNIKPYLRPMSSMTEEEKKELQEIAVALSYNKDDIIVGTQINSFRQLDGVLELFNSHHLDWRGLIEKGLALEAPEDMYKKLL